MYYETIYVSKHDAAQFMNEVKPKTASIDLSDSVDVGFEFTNEDDFKRARAWVYGKYDFIVTADNCKIGTIFYDGSNDYCFECYDDEHIEYGYTTPAKAEDALLEYYYSNKGVA